MIFPQTTNPLKHASPGIWIFIILLAIASCNGEINPAPKVSAIEMDGCFLKVRDGSEIFIWEHVPVTNHLNTIYIISGITGINHMKEKEIIDILSNNVNRVVAIHPRGTGYSDGIRGDTDPDDIIEDYCEIIKSDSSYLADNDKIFLFGHSMSCAFAVETAARLPRLDGMILVNPPNKLKHSKGMSPGFSDYLKYIGYFVFAPHAPVVNMAGDPSVIKDESDRLESEQRNGDTLLVMYFSMRCMAESKKIMNSMINNARKADYPLLLLYGENDNIVDRTGCTEIFSVWQCQSKRYLTIKDGTHGKSTVIKGAETIAKWIESI